MLRFDPGAPTPASVDRRRLRQIAETAQRLELVRVELRGDPIAIAGYLGSSDAFDRALIEFADRYADRNQRDYEAFLEEINSGRLAADSEVA